MIKAQNEFVMDNIPFPLWVRDLDGRVIFQNKKFKSLYRYNNQKDIKVNQQICRECFISHACKKEVQKVLKTKTPVEFEVEINKTINRCYMNPYFDHNNKLLGVMGILIDITDTKKNQKTLEERENILRTIIDTLPDYIFYKDKDSRYVGYNKKWKEYYESLGVASMIGKDDFEAGAVSKEQATYYMNQDKQVMESKEMIINEYSVKDLDGKDTIEEIKKVPVLNEDGEVWGIVGLVSDITEKIKLREKLRKLSYTDSLTKVYNRAYFEEVKQSVNFKENLPIGIIMGDVNGLKVVNDTFGHIEGDKLLKAMADLLGKVVSEKDFIFRWGGDEFILLIPNCDENKCESIIARVMKECKKHNFGLMEMSISLGSSIKKSVNEDIYDNLKEAEEKLYRQKFLKEKSIRSSIIFSLNQSLHEKNVETEEHTKRLVKYAIEIGRKLNFTTAQLDELELATKLHDIGKIVISEDILLKPDKLTNEEFEEMKTHTEKGHRILYASRELSHIGRIVLTHHERYDGNGYPLRLKGEDIPIMARIINVVDSYDAMTSYRGYNKVKTKKEAIEEIYKCRGGQFDPKIADIFIEILKNTL